MSMGKACPSGQWVLLTQIRPSPPGPSPAHRRRRRQPARAAISRKPLAAGHASVPWFAADVAPGGCNAAGGREGDEPMGAQRSVRRGPLTRRRWLRAAPLAALAVAVSLLVPAAGRAVPGGRVTLVSSSAALAGNPA